MRFSFMIHVVSFRRTFKTADRRKTRTLFSADSFQPFGQRRSEPFQPGILYGAGAHLADQLLHTIFSLSLERNAILRFPLINAEQVLLKYSPGEGGLDLLDARISPSYVSNGLHQVSSRLDPSSGTFFAVGKPPLFYQRRMLFSDIT